MVWCCVEPNRLEKSSWVMRAVAQGFNGKICVGPPPDDGEPFFVWGQKWVAIDAIQEARRTGRPFIQIDNGYVRPANGTQEGYHRLCVNGMSARYVPAAPKSRIDHPTMDWHRDGQHLVLALPGFGFGCAIGLDMPAWISWAKEALPRRTKRQILVRPKLSDRPLSADLNGAWGLITHSSNVAVEAILRGYPAFVAPTSPVAPVARVSFDDFEDPIRPDRTLWFNSLMAQQFTLAEISSGMAREYTQFFTKDF